MKNIIKEIKSIKIEENENTFTNTASSKKEAQRLSAYEMLLDLMDMYYDEDDE